MISGPSLPGCGLGRDRWQGIITELGVADFVIPCEVQLANPVHFPATGARAMTQAKYSIGQCVQHKLFDYRGVIVDVDPCFQGTDEWYEAVAKSRPPRGEPWYHVLVHNAQHETYVAERNLAGEESPEPVNHPLLGEFFDEFRGGVYMTGRYVN